MSGIGRSGLVVLTVVGLTAATSVVAPPPAAAFTTGTYLVASNGMRPALSANGRFVAFLTPDRMSPLDTNSLTDAYVRDVQLETLTLVSDGGPRGATEVDISDDGSRVAFITPGGAASGEAWVRDLPTGFLINATRGPSGLAPDSQVFNVAISGNGRVVAFNTQATTLLPGTGSGHDVFVKNVDTGLLEVASTSATGNFANGIFSIFPSLSFDGRRVAFVSSSTNLSPDDTDTAQDLYRKDLDTGAVSVAQLSSRIAIDSSLSADGTQAVFATSFLTSSPAEVYHHDFTSGVSTVLNLSPCLSGARVKLDGSGQRFAVVCHTPTGVQFKDRGATPTGTVLVTQPANALAVAVSADGGAFAWEDRGPVLSALWVQRLTNTDDTPPQIEAVLTPPSPDGDNGWYRSDVSLTWTVSDPESTVVTAGCADEQIAADQADVFYTCSASSDGGSAGPVEVSVRRDTTAPELSATASPVAPDGNAGWYVGPPSVSFTCSDSLSGMASCPPTVSAGDGVTLVQGSARDNAGNTTSLVVGQFKVDLTNPTVVCGPAPTFALHSGAAVVTGLVQDSGSGPASAIAHVTVDTSSVGAKVVAVVGADIAGRTASIACPYFVGYGFSGFFAPVDPQAVNVGSAGKAIPLKWRVVDVNGAPVTDLTDVSVSVVGHACDLGATQDQLEEVAAGASGLQNQGNGYYQFNWKTPKTYAQSCKTLRVDLGDGVARTAEFRFTK